MEQAALGGGEAVIPGGEGTDGHSLWAWWEWDGIRLSYLRSFPTLTIP